MTSHELKNRTGSMSAYFLMLEQDQHTQVDDKPGARERIRTSESSDLCQVCNAGILFAAAICLVALLVSADSFAIPRCRSLSRWAADIHLASCARRCSPDKSLLSARSLTRLYIRRPLNCPSRPPSPLHSSRPADTSLSRETPKGV